MSIFKKAERKRVFLKIALTGPSGSGKTYSALQLASGLADGGTIAGIDTENGSMSLYANVADFDVVSIAPPFNPKKCMEAINAAREGGYKVLVIDSQTHFWKQILEDKEKLDRAGGNSFMNWGKVRPQYDALKEAILQAPLHIVCCIRAKDEYVLEKNHNGKDAPKKVGMGAIAEPGAEFEYTTVFDIGMDHNATVSKDRTTMFAGEIEMITPDTGKRFLSWLDSADSQDYAEEAQETDQAKAAKILASLNLGPDGTDDLKALVKAQGLKLSAFLIDAHGKGHRTAAEMVSYLNRDEEEAATAAAAMEAEAQGQHEAHEAEMAAR